MNKECNHLFGYCEGGTQEDSDIILVEQEDKDTRNKELYKFITETTPLPSVESLTEYMKRNLKPFDFEEKFEYCPRCGMELKHE